MARFHNPNDLDVVVGSNQVKRKRINDDDSNSKWGAVQDEDDDDDDDTDGDDEDASWQSSITKNNQRIEEEQAAMAASLSEETREAAAAAAKRALKQQQALQAQQDKEHAIHAAIAQAQGLEFQVVLPSMDEVNKNNKANQQAGGGEMDAEMTAEWEALMEGDAEDSTTDKKLEIGLASDTDKEEVDARAKSTPAPVLPNKSLSFAKRAGIRIGSAGGWSLEVFPGDFVVHRKYGIGRFDRTCLQPKTKLSTDEIAARDKRRAEILTIKLKELQDINGSVTAKDINEIRDKFGTEEDTDIVSNPQTTVLEVSYMDGIVHVPLDRAYRLSRYRAGDAAIKPKLSRLRGDTWAKATQRVEENTMEMAQDVLALYATRETVQRTPFDPAKEVKVKQLEETFAFEPTVDQKKCFEDVENDMIWRSRPMDRLVCGDVGFGKTEIAFRALYRAIINGKQAALLAPTGVLASQHYKNLMKRMGPDTPFNLKIALLCGGSKRGTLSAKDIREQISSGEADLVVGTHALLSNRVSFKNLGLLVVDEEQRFGVKQKERLKLIYNGVDVLTLSATPIPRTLQMSLSGIRDTSTLRSPPPMRKPTVTYVQEYDEDLVRQAIETELNRGGQIYYVVPKISMLDDAEETIKQISPDIRIIRAHGRMLRNGAEENVAAFAEGKHDVLLATTVIENGVDIPTVNTIIVVNSQAFGMSTLYQLRGRVGRSDKQAYAYFFHRVESYTETAAMRLQALAEMNELGSGFDIANRDLEIRGAGSLLGTEQSGLAAKVGFDLYMRMLKKSIRKLRGLDLPLVVRTSMLVPTFGSPDTFSVSEDYIQDKEVMYKEAAKARLAENTAQLVALTNYWKETYGPLPAHLQSQLKTMHLHASCRRLGIDLVGIVEGVDGPECVLRSPGLRPRHIATIASLLPRGVLPKGVDVCFPGRFSPFGVDIEISGGSKEDIQRISGGESSDDQDDEGWDQIDQEESEAIKEITSAVNVKHIDEVDLEQYPRFIVRDFESVDKLVDVLLKLLLPMAKIVFEKQREQGEEAKVAVELRDRAKALGKRQRHSEEVEMRRSWMNELGAFDD
ncbi:hypothetical protein MPSEU_000039100 [Mayamaea pseudoterrestris]|nr:hypothetical protein MPSEU_000039100 [Mayamaea pseudoterrestris]